MHTVIIVGAPVACKEGIKDTWRDLSKWVAGQLSSRYEDQVTVTYFDLFDPGCPPLPPESQLPLVLVDGVAISSGGKISIPLIRRRIEESEMLRR